MAQWFKRWRTSRWRELKKVARAQHWNQVAPAGMYRKGPLYCTLCMCLPLLVRVLLKLWKDLFSVHELAAHYPGYIYTDIPVHWFSSKSNPSITTINILPKFPCLCWPHGISTARREKGRGGIFFLQIEPNWPLPFYSACSTPFLSGLILILIRSWPTVSPLILSWLVPCLVLSGPVLSVLFPALTGCPWLGIYFHIIIKAWQFYFCSVIKVL